MSDDNTVYKHEYFILYVMLYDIVLYNITCDALILSLGFNCKNPWRNDISRYDAEGIIAFRWIGFISGNMTLE